MVLTGAYNRALSFLAAHMLSCPFRKYLHMDCPGCGMQRSMLAFLSGDVRRSLQLHPAGILTLLLFVLLILHLAFRFRWGSKVLIALQLSIAFISLSFYVYKIIHHQIFY